MSSNNSIYYENLNKTKLIIYADKDTYKTFLLSINAFYNDDDTWIVSKNKEEELKKFICDVKLGNLVNNFKSRKEQKKYHREISESESESDNDTDKKSKYKLKDKVTSPTKDKVKSIDSIYKEEIDIKKKQEKTKFESEKENYYNNKEENLKKKYKSSDPMLYYKSFNSKPDMFKKVNNYDSTTNSDSDVNSSSYCSSSSEDDDDLTPKTPKKRKKYNSNLNNENYDDLISEVKSLQRKLFEVELENKKLKTKK